MSNKNYDGERFYGGHFSDLPIVRPLVRGETIDALLQRFKKTVEKSGIHQTVRRKSYFVSPSQRRRSKSNLARKRAA